jgi:hypothetical protein
MGSTHEAKQTNKSKESLGIAYFRPSQEIPCTHTAHCHVTEEPSACPVRRQTHTTPFHPISFKSNFVTMLPSTSGARGVAVVEALRYKPEGHGIDIRWCH